MQLSLHQNCSVTLILWYMQFQPDIPDTPAGRLVGGCPLSITTPLDTCVSFLAPLSLVLALAKAKCGHLFTYLCCSMDGHNIIYCMLYLSACCTLSLLQAAVCWRKLSYHTDQATVS